MSPYLADQTVGLTMVVVGVLALVWAAFNPPK